MNCRETERLLDTFFDGELEGRLMRDAALHITRCPSCEQELQEKERVRTVLGEAIQEQVDAVDLSGVWTAVQAGIDREETLEPAHDEPSVDEPARMPRAFGRRRGGRHGGASSRGARRSVGRVSAAAGAGAVAVGLAAVLLFPAEQQELRMENASTGRSLDGGASPVRVAEPGASQDTAPERVVAKRSSPSEDRDEPAVEAFARAPQPLASEWRQVQVGPAEGTDHAMSLWREASAP